MPRTKKTDKDSTQSTTQQTPPQPDSFSVSGKELVAKVKELIHEGNIRQITILDKSGKTILVLPLTLGVVGALVAPVLAAVGAVAALVTECTIKVERS